ncbi:MAG TPA: LamG-like jellyroll fold domain-containing protein, partial [Candidatus Saccharimonadales bacterium]|nr:LamG-like jellyroll fold domain-containing protein [Candidatus Saccharimonadales bacterium]
MQPYNPTDQATTAWFRKYHKYLFILLSLLVLLIVGSTYAAINLTAQNPPEHSALTPGINLAQGEKGLIGWWKLNGNLTDSTPYADNGTNYGATAAADRKGQANGAMAFDGSSDYATIPNSPALQNTPANQWTMSAWVYPTSATGTHDILRKGGSGSGYFLRLTGGSTLQSLFSWGGSSNYAQE